MGALIVAGITSAVKEPAMNPEQPEHDATADLTSEDLVEEVSIDGMCGVY
jgi:mycofactocin precursor